VTDDQFTPLPPVEPSADLRQIALQIRGLYLAYRESGFTEEQAMDLVKAQISAAGKGSGGEG
jgi:hypothetical protein